MVIVPENPFQRQKFDEEKILEKFETISLKLNKEERDWLNSAKLTLQQPKDSTALKTLAKIGEIVIHDEKNKLLISIILKNLARNERTGAYVDTSPKLNFSQM